MSAQDYSNLSRVHGFHIHSTHKRLTADLYMHIALACHYPPVTWKTFQQTTFSADTVIAPGKLLQVQQLVGTYTSSEPRDLSLWNKTYKQTLRRLHLQVEWRRIIIACMVKYFYIILAQIHWKVGHNNMYFSYSFNNKSTKVQNARR